MEELRLTDREFQAWRRLIHDEVGISLGEQKREMVQSRLARRLRATGCRTYQEYYDRLVAGELGDEERIRMANAITTNKTDFFRERAHFEFLEQELVPAWKVRAARGGERRIRIWSAGCSTGEEPYSIAITLREALGNLPAWDVRLLASDVDTDALAEAAGGIYPAGRVADIPAAILHRNFRRGIGSQAGRVMVSHDVRHLVAFRRINLIENPWPIRTSFDCIFCRNVIIYFDKATQCQLVDRFSPYLRDDGYLFLGHSETLHGITDQFAFLRNTIYKKTGSAEARGHAEAAG